MSHPHPMLNRYIVPDMPSADELLPYLRQLDDNRWYSNFGPLVTQFEDRLQMHLSAPDDIARYGPLYLTSLMTCYDALVIGLQLFKLPANAKVLVPAVTFPACPLAVRHAGAEAVLADIDAANWQLTPAIARNIAARTPIHAVMPVAIYGVPVDAAAWDDFMRDTGIPVIIDAAAALESQPVPTRALLAHSLHATKPFCIGEGGILISRNKEWIDRARCLSNFGTLNRITVADGCNAKLSEYLGAVALAQLDRWHRTKHKRAELFQRYYTAIKTTGLDLSFQQGIDQTIVGTLMLQSRLDATHIAAQLHTYGIFAHHMYLPALYHHPFFAGLAVADASGTVLSGTATIAEKTALMQNTENLQRSAFGLPFHNFITDADIAFVTQALTEILDRQ